MTHEGRLNAPFLWIRNSFKCNTTYIAMEHSTDDAVNMAEIVSKHMIIFWVMKLWGLWVIPLNARPVVAHVHMLTEEVLHFAIKF